LAVNAGRVLVPVYKIQPVRLAADGRTLSPLGDDQGVDRVDGGAVGGHGPRDAFCPDDLQTCQSASP